MFPTLLKLPSLDDAIAQFDKALRTVFAPAFSHRPYPDAGLAEAEMSEVEKKHAAGLMRINHSGEVCAQALYAGQALTARNPEAQQALLEAAQEETEHLAWCEKRLNELGSHKSLLNPFWPGRWGTSGTWVSWPKPSTRWRVTWTATWTSCRPRTPRAGPSSNR